MRHPFLVSCWRLILSLLCVGGVAGAQEAEVGPARKFAIFLDRSYISNTLPYRDLIFEAQIAPPLFLFQNTPDRVNRIFDPSAFRWTKSWSLAFTPLMKLRMINEESAPVRTPSFMPKIDLQLFQFRRSNRGAGQNEAQIARQPVWMLSQHLTVGHHSNGQEGCLFLDETRVEGVCADPVPLPPTREVNFKDGSFSTNYVRMAVEGARIWLDDNLRLRKQIGLSVAWETHPPKFGPGGVNETLRPLLGGQRGRVLGELIQKTTRPNGLFRGEASVEAFNSDWPGIPSTILSARAEWTFDKIGGWGVMLRGYRGQDYYNLGFARTLSELQLGLVFDAGRWLEFEIVP
jgi:hypothetical protein